MHNLKYDLPQLQYSGSNVHVENITEHCGTVKSATLTITNIGEPAKTLYFKDSYSLINKKLKDFSLCFNLPSYKDVCPYALYTDENRKKRYLPLQECLDAFQEDNSLLEDQIAENQKQFTINIQENKEFTNEEGLIDIMRYATYYCLKDCEILLLGCKKFNDDLTNIYHEFGSKFDGIDQFVSISSIGKNLAGKYGCFDGVMELTGKPQNFIMKCISGGRCMISNNKKQYIQTSQEYLKEHINITQNMNEKGQIINSFIHDCDCCSLYPSSMSIMPGIDKGAPKIIPNNSLDVIYDKDIPFAINKETTEITPIDEKMEVKVFLPNMFDNYYIEIEIVEVSDCYKFPLIFNAEKYKTEKKKVYSNCPNKSFYLDKRSLLDCIEFYPVFKWKFIRGYYFSDGFNNKINTLIKKLYEKRAEYKKAKNPLQETIKLLLNSIYGKSILKPIKYQIKFMPSRELTKFVMRKQNQIIEIVEDPRYKAKIVDYITETLPLILDDNQVLIKKWVNTNHPNLIHKIESLITFKLYSTKNAPNELPKDSEEYKYLKQLEEKILHVGKHCNVIVKLIKPIHKHFNMPQFGVSVLSWSKHIMNTVITLAEQNQIPIHYTDTDSFFYNSEDLPKLEKLYFDMYKVNLTGTELCNFHDDFPTINGKVAHSIKFIACGKKSYYHKLINEDGEILERFTMKGIPQNVIIKNCLKFGITIEQLYEDLHQGKAFTFDMLIGCSCFRRSKFHHYYTPSSCSKTIQFCEDVEECDFDE
jgi:hypothetical protein